MCDFADLSYFDLFIYDYIYKSSKTTVGNKIVQYFMDY